MLARCPSLGFSQVFVTTTRMECIHRAGFEKEITLPRGARGRNIGVEKITAVEYNGRCLSFGGTGMVDGNLSMKSQK